MGNKQLIAQLVVVLLIYFFVCSGGRLIQLTSPTKN